MRGAADRAVVMTIKSEGSFSRGLTWEQLIEKDYVRLTNDRVTYLNLSSEQLSALPADIGKLDCLTHLHLRNNHLSALPADIGKLACLTELHLSNNKLSALPADIGQLACLTTLNLDNNELTALPVDIGQLSCLTQLNLNTNQLHALPADIGQLSCLTTLNLNNNRLSALPADIGQLACLTTLNLNNNRLSVLPADIGQLARLTTLNLRNNKLSALPADIGQLASLTTLNLNNNQLSALPADIGQLSCLTDLHLCYNQLSALPADVGKLDRLKTLDLYFNRLSALPADVGNLVCLTSMNINNNKLTALPVFLGKLAFLTSLDLRNNPIASGLENLRHLTKLFSLYLSPSDLLASSLDFPAALRVKSLQDQLSFLRKKHASADQLAAAESAAAAKAAKEQAEREHVEKAAADKLESPFSNLRLILGSTAGSAHIEPSEIPFEYLANCTLQWAAERKLGDGTFGDVFLAVDPDRQLRFVVKKINVSSLSLVSSTPVELGRRMWSNEIVALTKFRSPLIVKLAGFTSPDARDVCLAYEYCAGGALDKALIDDGKANELTYKQRIRIALGVAKALNFLHRGGGERGRCFHRDVKSANICLTSTREPKLIDCGLARVIPEGDGRVAVTATGNSQPGTLGYMCPRYQNGEKFTEKSEVFAFGVVLLELVTGDITIIGKRGNLYDRFIDDGEETLAGAFDIRAEIDGGWPEAVKAKLSILIQSCLIRKPDNRLGLSTALQRLRTLEREFCAESGLEKMVSSMREERERLVAVAQIKEAAERAARKTCVVCLDELSDFEGIECDGGHFCCSSDFDRFVNAKIDPESMRLFGAVGGIVGCPAHQCGAPPFAWADIARQVSVATFEGLSNARAKLAEQRISSTLEKDFEQRLKLKEVEWQKLSEGERRRRANRNHVVERILTLSCPRCGQAFLDFNGCFALTCSRDNTAFCAYCLADCGADAHRHVANCLHNTAPGKNVYASIAVFETAQRNRRVRMLRAHLAQLRSEERKTLTEDCAVDLRDLGIDSKGL